MRYWTDEISLFEVVSEHRQRNYGLRPGETITMLLRDVVTELEFMVDAANPMALRPVYPQEHK